MSDEEYEEVDEDEAPWAGEDDLDISGLGVLDQPENQGLGYRFGLFAGAFFAIIGVLLAIGAVVVGIWAIVDAFPSSAPKKANPGWLDVIFENRFAIWFGRLTLFAAVLASLFLALYVVASIVMRMNKGHWLRSGGPFHADLTEAEQRVADLQPLLTAAWQANEELAERLQESTDELDRLYRERDALYDQLAELEEEPPDEG